MRQAMRAMRAGRGRAHPPREAHASRQANTAKAFIVDVWEQRTAGGNGGLTGWAAPFGHHGTIAGSVHFMRVSTCADLNAGFKPLWRHL